jgi:hypothetical protein
MLGDARLAPLVADYVRGADGAADVLRDAFLERGLELLPPNDATEARLDGVLARLPTIDQLRIASASVRELVPGVRDRKLQRQLAEGLDAVVAIPAVALDLIRGAMFKASQSGVDRRVAFSAWMLLRGSPAIALRTARAIRPTELDAQIARVAAAFAA